MIERLHEEFRRRVKAQRSLPSVDAALVRLVSLVASGQSKLRRIDGWRKFAAVLATAAKAAGDSATARKYFEKLVALAKNADPERSEVQEAKTFLTARR